MTAAGGSQPAPRIYPPPVHLLRDLGLSISIDAEQGAEAVLPVSDHLRTVGQAVQPGILALLVDAVGGSLSAPAAWPDRVATTDLTLHCWHPAAGGPIIATGSVLRRGRNTVVIEVALADGAKPTGPAVGRATMTFAVLAHRPENPVIGGAGPGRRRWPPDPERGQALAAPVLEQIGLETLDPGAGRLRIELADYVRNSFDALNGGVVATVAEVAGSSAAGCALGGAALTRQLTLHYLAQGRFGPIETRADVLGTTGRSAVVRVELIDTGAGDRTTAVATVVAGRPAAAEPDRVSSDMI